MSGSPKVLQPQAFAKHDSSLIVPERMMSGKCGKKIQDSIDALKASAAESFHGADLFFNVGHIPFVNGEVLDGVNVRLKYDLSVNKIIDHLQPLYQAFCVFNLGDISADKIAQLDGGLLKKIIDPEQSWTRESNEQDSDLVETYENGANESTAWFSRVGLCNAYVMVVRESEGKYILVVSGGHPQLHETLMRKIKEDTDLKIHDLVESARATTYQSKLGRLIDDIKHLQYVNHCKLASRVKEWLKTGEVVNTRHTDIETDVSPFYWFHYNTVHQSFEDSTKHFVVSQGVLDARNDVTDESNKDEQKFYLVRDPREIHVLTVKNESHLKVSYFPISTGYSEYVTNDPQEYDRKVKSLFEKIQVAGISNVSAIWKAYYQPFDKTLKTSINNMLAPFGWILVSNATALPVVAVIVNGFDSGSIPAEAWVKFLENRPKFEKYLVPVTSSIVNLIRETYHHAMTELQKAGHEVQKLEHVIEQSVFYPAFAWIAVGSARIALILKQHLLESAPTAVQYGRPRDWS